MPTKGELQDALSAVEASNQILHEANDNLQQKLDDAAEEMASLNHTIGKGLDELAAAGQEIAKLNNDVSKVLSDQNAATVKICDLEARAAGFQDLDEANQDLRDRIAKLQTGDQAAAAEEEETANENLAGAKLNATEAKRAAEVARKKLFAFDQEAMVDTKAIPDSVMDGNERRGLVRDVNRMAAAWFEAKGAVSAAKDVVESFAA